MNNDIAIKVSSVSKTFRIPHEKITSVKGAVTSLFRSGGYEEFKALDDVSFEVKKGEFFGIIGRNGSGKSTLLKILAGIYQADKGKVQINGMISPFLELGIGFNPELSGRDNVYLNATVLGMTKKQIDKKFDDIVKFSELERFIDQKLKNYSSGMQVRLAFSVSIHANRDILLMDEVLAVGDTNFQSKCLEEFNRYKELGKTVILVTHDIKVVQRYCNRAMLVRNGKIIKIGKADEVANEYIQVNISDEENSLFETDNNKSSKSAESLAGNEESEIKSQKIAEITRIEFLDKDGQLKNVFRTGDNISVRVYFRRNGKLPILNFGIGIFNQECRDLFGVKTFVDKLETSKMIKYNYFQVNYENIPLRSGIYYVQSAIWGSMESNLICYMPKSNPFRIHSADRNDGIVDIKHSWSNV